MNVNLEEYIRDVPDFPKPGILFKDISPLLGNPQALGETVRRMKDSWDGKVDMIAALDARGFIFGGILAYELGIPLVMLRKKGKLPGETVEVSYDLEYGSATIEAKADAFRPDLRVLVVDDLLATGGTAKAACVLVENAGAVVASCLFVVELADLGGRQQLAPREVRTLVAYGEVPQ